jgi:hypothetical protein
MPSTHLPWSALKAVHDHFATVAFDICATSDEVPHTLMAVKADASGEVTHMAPVAAGSLHTYFRNDAGKDRFARLLKGLLNDSSEEHRHFVAFAGFSPDLLVQVNEAWMTAATPGTKPGTAGRSSKSPPRKEVIAISMHTRQGTVAVCHEIATKPKRHAVPAEFPTPEVAPLVSGRFSTEGAATQEHGAAC